MKKIVLTAVLALVSAVARAGDIVLAEKSATEYKIVINASAPLPVQFAAEELQTFLKESTGAEFPIVTEASGTKTIEVGTEKARAIVAAAYPRPFKIETSAVVTDGDTLAIWGAGESGAAYGVYQFLERVVLNLE